MDNQIDALISDPDTVVFTTINEDWYQCLSDLLQSEYWTDLLIQVFKKYGPEEAFFVSSSLENYLPLEVVRTVGANVRSFRTQKYNE